MSDVVNLEFTGPRHRRLAIDVSISRRTKPEPPRSQHLPTELRMLPPPPGERERERGGG